MLLKSNSGCLVSPHPPADMLEHKDTCVLAGISPPFSPPLWEAKPLAGH